MVNYNVTDTNILDSYDMNDKNSIISDGVTNTDSQIKSKFDSIPIISEPFDEEKCICQITITPEMFKYFMNITLSKLFGGYNMNKQFDTFNTEIQVFLDSMFEMWQNHNIDNCRRKAHYLGQVWLETDSFNTLLEYASGKRYNPGMRDDAIPNGNTEEGDGPKYKGRGCLQLTWKNNYIAYTKFLVDSNLSTDDVVINYELVTSHLFHALYSSGWFWEFGKVKNNGEIINLNELSDQLLTDRISTLINGGGNGRAERKKITENILTYFNYKKCIHYIK